MHVPERIVRQALRRAEAEPGTGEAAWFAQRQPEVVRYLEASCGRNEALGVALFSALAIHAAFETAAGAPPPRVTGDALARAERAIVTEACAGELPAGGVLARQTAVAELIATLVASPPLPLGDEASTRLAIALLAVAGALDEATGGAHETPASPAPESAAATARLDDEA